MQIYHSFFEIERPHASVGVVGAFDGVHLGHQQLLRAAVDAAFCRLIERWHPDRAAPGDPEAVREAQRMVQAINDAYQTLVKIAPNSAEPPAPQQTATPPALSKVEGPRTSSEEFFRNPTN